MSPSYFFYELEIPEAEAYLRGLEESRRSAWEQSRLVAYVIAQVNSRKQMRPSDIVPLPWDGETSGDRTPEPMTEEEKREIEEEMKYYESVLNHKNVSKEG